MPKREEAVERRFGALDIGELNSLSALLGQQWEGHGAHHLYAEVEAERKLRYDTGEHGPVNLRSQEEAFDRVRAGLNDDAPAHLALDQIEAALSPDSEEVEGE